jgi:feruloyl-CoA synthase
MPTLQLPNAVTKLSGDGHTILSSGYTLGDYPVSVPAMLHRCAEVAPNNIWLAERPQKPITDESWRTIKYGDGLQVVKSIGQGVLGLMEYPGRIVLCLSDNSIDYGLFMMGLMEAGIPFAPVTPNYGFPGADLSRLKHIISVTKPAMVYVEDAEIYGPVLSELFEGTTIVAANNASSDKHTSLANLKKTVPGAEIQNTYDNVDGDTVAKIMFTSGSTGKQKGVIIPHRMLCSNMAASARIWPFMTDHPAIILDWLPWSHSMGGNHNFDLPLYTAGTMYIDSGKPTDKLFEQTVINYRDISPTYVTNVPVGFSMLVDALEKEPSLAENFFRRVDILYYASASLPQHIWDRLKSLTVKYCDKEIPVLSGWGGTEMGPSGTKLHWAIDKAGMIGTPLPGTEVKLEPVGNRMELRMRGPNVTTGYLNMPEKTADAFDEEGFYCSGDAGEFVDPEHPELGLSFKGRISENFKLITGAWVDVGDLRLTVIAAANDVIKDAVIVGHDQEYLSLLVVPNIDGCRRLVNDDAGKLNIKSLTRHPYIISALVNGLKAHNKNNPGSSRRVSRAVILTTPPDMDTGEITEKGYINQRAMLDRRAAEVKSLYSDDDTNVIMIDE